MNYKDWHLIALIGVMFMLVGFFFTLACFPLTVMLVAIGIVLEFIAFIYLVTEGRRQCVQ